jgi:signal peptidase I/conjugal transfer pilin signal peptidase TrbI
MGNTLNHKLAVYLTALGVVTVSLLLVHQRFAVTVTPSLKYKVFYLKERSGSEIRRGEYVLFNLDNPVTREFRFKKTIKQIACASGDRLSVNDRDYYCNGLFIGRAKDLSLRNEKVTNFVYSGEVPSGSLFVMGHSKDSYDSRYFGFIGSSDVVKIAYPLF